MKTTLRVLVALGVAVQAAIIYASWDEFGAAMRSDLGGIGIEAAALLISPTAMGIGGAITARRLHQRGSAWAWVVAGIPLVLLGLALSLAAFLWFNPITHQR